MLTPTMTSLLAPEVDIDRDRGLLDSSFERADLDSLHLNRKQPRVHRHYNVDHERLT